MEVPVADAPPPTDSLNINAFTGIKNTVSRERLAPGQLASAVNVDIDDAGQVHRRRGYTKVSSDNYHSLFTTAAGKVYVVKNNNLGWLNSNYTFTPIKTGIGPHHLAYVQVGPDVYFSSPTDSGVIHEDDAVGLWGALNDAGIWLSPVVNPTDDLPPIAGKQLRAPPMATTLTQFSGRIYLGSRDLLWATELYLYHYVDTTKNFRQFESEIRVLGSVDDGIYVGTDDTLWFLSGNFHEQKRTACLNVRCIPGSMVEVHEDIASVAGRAQPGLPADSRNALLVMTSAGLVLCATNGRTTNLTQNDVWFPDAISASAMYRRQDGINQYVSVLDSGGTPSAATRVGDYLDATIIRGIGV